MIVREVPVAVEQPKEKSGCSVWQVVGVLLIIVLVLVIGSMLGL